MLTDLLLSEASEDTKRPAVARRVSLRSNAESSHDQRPDKEISLKLTNLQNLILLEI